MALNLMKKLKKCKSFRPKLFPIQRNLNLNTMMGPSKLCLKTALISESGTTRDMTSDRQNNNIRWVNRSAVKNRVTLGSRKTEQISQLDNCQLLPTAADHGKQRRDFTYLVSCVLVEHLHCLEFLQSVHKANTTSV